MPEPVLSVEWELGGLWLPVNTNPRRVSYRRGRDRAQDKTNPGRCTLVFGNGDRHMDPEHNAYFALLKPGTRVRLRAEWDGVTYDLFTGYLENMVQHFGNNRTPHDAIMTWTLVDGLSVLANAGVPSAWEVNVRGLAPRTWYRFNESNGPYLFDNVGTAHGTYHPDVEYGIASEGALGYPPDESDMQVRFPLNTWTVIPADAIPSNLANWSMTFNFTMANPPAAAQNLLYQFTYPYGLQITWAAAGGEFEAVVRNSAGAVTASVKTDFGQWGTGMLPTLVAAAGQPLKVYAGDFLLKTGVGTGHNLPNAAAVMPLPQYEEVIMNEVIFYDRALTPAEMTTLLEGYGGWSNPVTGTPGEPVATRIGRILDAIEWPVALRDITTEAPGRLKAHREGSALSILQAIEATIEGRLWVDPSGVLRLESLRELARAPYTDVQASFTDDGTANPYVGIGSYELGWELLTNVVRRTNGDFVISARDEASITTYGLRDMTDVADVESLYETLEYESDLANYRVAHYSEPVRHVNGVKVLPSGEPDTLYPVVLGLDLGERIAFSRTPQGIGAPLDHEALVEGIKVDIGPKKWEWDYSIDAVYALEFFRFDITEWDSPDWRFTA